MAIGIKGVITIGISIMVIALIFPLALGLIGIAENTIIIPAIINATDDTIITPAVLLSDTVDTSVLTLLTILTPILAVIGIAISFIKSGD